MVGGEEGGGVASSVLCVEGSVRGTKTERKFHENFASARRAEKAVLRSQLGILPDLDLGTFYQPRSASFPSCRASGARWFGRRR